MKQTATASTSSAWKSATISGKWREVQRLHLPPVVVHAAG